MNRSERYDSTEFVTDLVDTFGTYGKRTGMVKIISQRLRLVKDDDLRKLFGYIADDYNRTNSPPPWAYIKSCVLKLGIPLEVQDYFYVSVCVYCRNEFSVDEYRCPNCGKHQGMGQVRKKNRNQVRGA